MKLPEFTKKLSYKYGLSFVSVNLIALLFGDFLSDFLGDGVLSIIVSSVFLISLSPVIHSVIFLNWLIPSLDLSVPEGSFLAAVFNILYIFLIVTLLSNFSIYTFNKWKKTKAGIYLLFFIASIVFYIAVPLIMSIRLIFQLLSFS